MLQSWRLALAIATGKTITTLVQGLGLGAASVLPGAIARRLYPELLPLLAAQITQGIILVCGTNGKTTTALLLRQMLTLQGYRVVHNETGANLVNGLITALLNQASWRGQLSADYGILEVDENVLPLIVGPCQPEFILALNLFRDQLDRYGEVDSISERWQQAIAPLNPDTQIILNGDDPTLAYLGRQLTQKVSFFGLSESELYLETIPYASDSTYCPSCGAALNYQGVYLSHLGDFDCSSCGFGKPDLEINSREWSQVLMGVYNKYNTLAALTVALKIGVERTVLERAIAEFKPAFGRAETLTINGKTVKILLAKNPVGMNETLRAVQQASGHQTIVTLLLLNDRTPDGTDVSWIWDVDTEQLTQLQGQIIVSGDRVYDLALRLQYTEPSPQTLIIKDNLSEALSEALNATPEDATLYILPTYSAMLEVRQLLTGKKIL
ncbi:Mur ligase family protein [Gloeocapsa sp. PCC 73106]|uniref:Mur ligase family protein n=1 Tax=Gloeocapsa sp. PCC 73106 TaxID=102232 RepID=UPI0002AC905B|nr:Mur ligase family protein [Gloeocapsa sp. PCC 73106]ELR98163.1 UDP-N-acetylmuramyl tripeptide synthase [Gloeocapsa sp. PCC 73106]